METLRVSIEAKAKEYYIEIGEGIIDMLYPYLVKRYNNSKAVIITDHNVAFLYAEKLCNGIESAGMSCHKVEISPGEENKNLSTLSGIYDKLAYYQINRNDIIVALGGGVVGDLSGFAAATYLRGIPYIQVPTTLLAQVDSSVGGKTGFNLSRGKNLVGAFYQPERVFIDTNFLKTLDKKYIRDGLAEIIKYGCIKDRILFDKLSSFKDAAECVNGINEIIYTCCFIKKTITEQDEKDWGMRQLLNFGHTLGHAVEQYFNYEKYTHGEAISMGMSFISKAGENLGITKKGTAQVIEKILEKYDLPYKIPLDDITVLAEAIKLDKKNKGDGINIVFLKEIGDGIIKKMRYDDIISILQS